MPRLLLWDLLWVFCSSLAEGVFLDEMTFVGRGQKPYRHAISGYGPQAGSGYLDRQPLLGGSG